MEEKAEAGSSPPSEVTPKHLWLVSPWRGQQWRVYSGRAWSQLCLLSSCEPEPLVLGHIQLSAEQELVLMVQSVG